MVAITMLTNARRDTDIQRLRDRILLVLNSVLTLAKDSNLLRSCKQSRTCLQCTKRRIKKAVGGLGVKTFTCSKIATEMLKFIESQCFQGTRLMQLVLTGEVFLLYSSSCLLYSMPGKYTTCCGIVANIILSHLYFDDPASWCLY